MSEIGTINSTNNEPSKSTIAQQHYPEYKFSGGDLLKVSNDEYIARLQARNRNVLSFIALSGTLIGISASNAGFGFIAVGVGFIALATSLLNRHHEIMMAHLRAYQIQLLGKSPAKIEFSFQSFKLEIINKVRKSRDNAVAFIYFGVCFVALSILAQRSMFFTTMAGLVLELRDADFYIWLLSLVASFFVCLYCQKIRQLSP